METNVGTQVEMNIEKDTTEVVPQPKQRNYSFKHKADVTLDAVDAENGETYVIPAQPGSTYWAILRIAYEHADSPLSLDEIIDQVAELLEDRDPEKWERYKSKGSVTTCKDGKPVQKAASDWRKRIETNIKTLTRSGGSNPYGQRLIERGHILRWEPNLINGDGGFILRTTTNEPLPKKADKQVTENRN